MNDQLPFSVGETILTNYGTGPFKIKKVYGPCTCPKYLESTPSEPHYHLTCSGRGSKGDFYLNGYRDNATSVWSQDYLIFPFRSQPIPKNCE